ncbi:hypothetical protein [Sphaerisporangium flaviroseum]
MVFVRFLSIGLLAGAVIAVALLSRSGHLVPTGDFHQWSLSVLLTLNFGQFLTVPTALLVFAWKGTRRGRPPLKRPGLLLGICTIVFGLFVMRLGLSTAGWIDTGAVAYGLGDPDAKYLLATFNVFLGAVTLTIGALISVVKIVSVLTVWQRRRKAS